MRLLFVFFSILIVTISSAQEKPFYSKVNKVLWDSDTIFTENETPPFNINDITVILSPVTSSCVIYVTNNTDMPIEVNWGRVRLNSNGNSILSRLRQKVNYDERQQIQKISKKGKEWQDFEAIYGDKVINSTKANNEYRKTKEPVPIIVEAIFPIIYNDEEVIIHKIDHGLYDPKYKP